jgi:hypothetical protein
VSPMTPDHRALSALLHPVRGHADRITEQADAEARAAGLTVEALPRGRRRYRDPHLNQLATHRAAQYADERNADLGEAGSWSAPTLTTAAGWSR